MNYARFKAAIYAAWVAATMAMAAAVASAQ